MTGLAAESWADGSAVLAGEFVVERHLGSGGRGEVLLLRSPRSEQRYAVKVLAAADAEAERRFMVEAQRWIDLPEHPHVVTCHFVRAVGDRLAVFADYVDGGSLASWIGAGRLTGPDALSPALRIAAGAAMGLAAAHDRGLLHLDVKPGNVLLTADGEAKIGDFGLAAGVEHTPADKLAMEQALDYLTDVGIDDERRAALKSALRAHAFSAGAEEPVTAAGGEGLTAPYASPEQLRGATLTGASDVWSWAATVLELLAGRRTWPRGPDAPIALAELVRSERGALGSLPQPLVELLRECLQAAPSARPISLRELAGRIGQVHAATCGTPLELPPEPVAAAPALATAAGPAWGDARAWLGYAYEAAGLDALEAVRHWPSETGTRKAKAIEHVRALREARRVLEPVAAHHGGEPAIQLGTLRALTARVLVSLGDRRAAVAEFEAAERILGDVHDPVAVARRSGTLSALAVVLRDDGDLEASLEASGHAISLGRAVAADDPDPLATALLVDANTRAGDPARMVLFEEAAALFEAAGEQDGLVRTLASMAVSLETDGDAEAAEPVWQRAEELLERQTAEGMVRTEDLRLRGTVSLNRARLAETKHARLRFARGAVDALRELVEGRGVHEAGGDFGLALFTSGRALEELDDPQGALACYRESANQLERAVTRDGRIDLVDELAESTDHEATVRRELGDLAGAVDAARRAVTAWDRLGELDGVAAWAGQTAHARIKLAGTLEVAKDFEAAEAELRAAFELLEAQRETLGPGAHRELEGMAYGSRATLRRRRGDIDGAIDDNRRALERIEGTGERAARARALRLQNLANALEDARQWDDARAAAAEARALLEEADQAGGNLKADLASNYQNSANRMFKEGDYEEAARLAASALELYDRLLEQGRSDLASGRARMRAVHALALERLFDIPAASRVTRVALGELRAAPGLTEETRRDSVRAMELRLDELTALEAAGPDTLEDLLAREHERLDVARDLSRSGHAAAAIRSLEDAFGHLFHLARTVGGSAAISLLGEAGTALGVVAFHGGSSSVAARAYQVAIDAHETLMEDEGGTDAVEGYARASVGLAALLAFHGHADAPAVVERMRARLETVDPARAVHWTATAQELLADAARSGPGS